MALLKIGGRDSNSQKCHRYSGGRFYSLALLTISLCAAPVRSQSATEYQVKAAFLYNFAKFIEWPSDAFYSPEAPLILGVLGDDPFGATLDTTVRGKMANGHPLVVRRFSHVQDLRACHVLFISHSEKERLPQILGNLRGLAILTVSEVDRFSDHGGVITFFIEQNRVRFEINIATADRAGLKISSKLLSVARIARS